MDSASPNLGEPVTGVPPARGPLRVRRGCPLRVRRGCPIRVRRGCPIRVRRGCPIRVRPLGSCRGNLRCPSCRPTPDPRTHLDTIAGTVQAGLARQLPRPDRPTPNRRWRLLLQRCVRFSSSGEVTHVARRETFGRAGVLNLLCAPPLTPALIATPAPCRQSRLMPAQLEESPPLDESPPDESPPPDESAPLDASGPAPPALGAGAPASEPGAPASGPPAPGPGPLASGPDPTGAGSEPGPPFGPTDPGPS